MRERQKKVLDLLDQHGKSLHRLLARVTRCEHATSDLMQELFIRLAGSGGFEKADRPYAFAWRSAANLAFEWRRRRRVTRALPDDAEISDDVHAAPVGRLVQAERVERVLAATGRLSELGRSVVIMRFIEEESYEEIGRRLGKNPNHIRVLCSKSIRKLRGMLDARDFAHAGMEVSHD